VLDTDAGTASLFLVDAEPRAGEDNIEIHSVNSDCGVVLQIEIDVLVNTESEVAGLGEVARLELVFLDGETLGEDSFSTFTTDSDMAGDLLVSSDAERSDSQARHGEDGFLLSQLLQHFGCSGETITTLTNADIHDQLLDLDFSHDVRLAFLLLCICFRHSRRVRFHV